MWNTLLIAAIIAAVVVGLMVIGKDDDFWNDEE